MKQLWRPNPRLDHHRVQTLHAAAQGHPFSSSSGLGPASNTQPEGSQRRRPALGQVTVHTCTHVTRLPWGVNLGWLPYAHRAALALLCSRLFHLRRPEQCRRDGGCHVTPVHLHSQGDGMFPQVNTPNTFPALDTVLLAALPSSSLFSPPQISAKTRSTLKQ